MLICMCAGYLNAQVPETSSLNRAHSSNEEPIFIPENFESNIDSLLNSWHVKYYTKRAGDCNSNKVVRANDSVYMQRLAALPRVINMTYNEQVRKCIDLYVERRSTLVEYMLGLADFYFPTIEKALDENNLPIELKYLVVVESAMNPTALSRAGASGLWQFMLPTGRIYGLEINSLIDERRDPVKSTYAACRYFKDMYEIYKDWDLVIASYNCGPGNVNKAIRRAGGKTNFWEIYQYLPRETRSYVPLFIAANYVMNYYNEHNICPVQTELPFSVDTVVISKQLHFDQVAEVLNVEKELLKALNPQYKRDLIPGNYKPCILTLPSVNAYSFVSLEDSIYSHRSEELLASTGSIKSGAGKERITHRVKSGETLVKIANQYGVTAAQVRKWNGLRSNRAGVGRKLILYVDNGGYALAQKNEDTESQPEEKTVTKKKMAKAEPVIKDSGSYRKYKVRSGDSFYTISQRFPGVSPQDLMRINNVRSTRLQVGQIINIPAV